MTSSRRTTPGGAAGPDGARILHASCRLVTPSPGHSEKCVLRSSTRGPISPMRRPRSGVPGWRCSPKRTISMLDRARLAGRNGTDRCAGFADRAHPGLIERRLERTGRGSVLHSRCSSHSLRRTGLAPPGRQARPGSGPGRAFGRKSSGAAFENRNCTAAFDARTQNPSNRGRDIFVPMRPLEAHEAHAGGESSRGPASPRRHGCRRLARGAA